jgi:hypothetical protein
MSHQDTASKHKNKAKQREVKANKKVATKLKKKDRESLTKQSELLPIPTKTFNILDA